MKKFSIAVLALGIIAGAQADLSYWNLGSGNFSQDWSNSALITADDDWSGVASIIGYRGDDTAGSVTAVDPQTILGAFDTVVDVNADEPAVTFTTGGIAEFSGLANPTVALQGSGTADNANLVFSMNASGRQNVTISYDLLDIDNTADNSVQPFALQYRIGGTGDYTNVSAGYVADASSGPNLGTLVTPVSVTLGAWDNVSQLQFRVLTTNAIGSDEWVGVDNISITSTPVPEPGTMAALGLGAAAMIRRRRNK